MSSTMGRCFAVTTFGESHGAGVGAVVDGCPAGLALGAEDIQPQLDRRRPGRERIHTARREEDIVEILSGVDGGVTIGSPIALLVKNGDRRPEDYEAFKRAPRPSHADYTYFVKYGAQASSGGGRASGRETLGRVAAGAIAEKLLRARFGVSVVAWVSAVGDVECGELDPSSVARKDVDRAAARCPDLSVAKRMEAEIAAAMKEGDSIGSVVTCVCAGVPAGWGEPVFEKAEAAIASAMLSIPAARGFEIGSGFAAARMRGSRHNDRFVRKGKVLGTESNRSGGVQGGITNGEPVIFRVAFKPPATIALPQETAGYDGKTATLEGKGRHDPCIGPRAVPVVEAMAALALADLALLARASGK